MMMTDNPFWCPTRYAAAGFTNSTGFPVWLYNFDHVASFDFWPPDKTSCASHVCKFFFVSVLWNRDILHAKVCMPSPKDISS